MKLGAISTGSVSISSFGQFVGFLMKLFTNYQSLAGLFLYFVSGLIWAYLLTKLDISFVQPILALTYVATPILAILFLDEYVSPLRWLGIFVIIVGVTVVAKSAG